MDLVKSNINSCIDQFSRRLKIRLFFARQPQRVLPLYPRIDNNDWQPDDSPDLIKINVWACKIKQRVLFLNKLINYQRKQHDRTTQLTIKSIKNLPAVIKPADKNLGTTLLSHDLYKKLCLAHLTDVNTYRKLATGEYNANLCYARLRKILLKHGVLWTNNYNKRTHALPPMSKLARSLLQLQGSTTLRLSVFYILPKLHKATLAGRPITSSINCTTVHTSYYLHNIFMLVLPFIRKSVVTSTREVLLRLPNIIATPQSVILMADVGSLYPSIPIEYGINAVRTVLSPIAEQLGINLPLVLDLLNWVLRNNYMEFDNITYLQLTGTAMGTPLAPMYANIVLYHLEQACLALLPIEYMRYIDDICAVCTNTEQANTIVNTFNNQCPGIKLDAITIDTHGVFLDLTINLNTTNDNTSITTSIYQKPINKYLYITPRSHHQRQIFKNFIYEECKRYRLHCSDDTTYYITMAKFAARLIKRGYSTTFLRTINAKIPTRTELLNALTTPAPASIRYKGPPLVLPADSRHYIKNPRSFFQLDNDITNNIDYDMCFGSNNVLIAYYNSPNMSQHLTRSRYPPNTLPSAPNTTIIQRANQSPDPNPNI